MAKATLWNCFERVINVICELSEEVIKWPDQQQRRIIENDFNRVSNLRGIVGVVDGTYIPIKAPSDNPEVYINRKCYHAITLQAICDNSKKFLDIFVGYPSSVSDCRIFRNSYFYQNVTNNFESFFEEHQYIIGDKAYPNLNWCVPPYVDRGNLQENQRLFNMNHASVRSVIERSFALLFGRFRRLKYIDMSRTDLIPKVVLASCVLHNICLLHNDGHLELYIEEGAAFVDNEINI